MDRWNDQTTPDRERTTKKRRADRVRAAALSATNNQSKKVPQAAPLPIPEEKALCPYCHSANTKSNGYVYQRDPITKKQIKTDKQRMKCNNCGRGWTPPTEAKLT